MSPNQQQKDAESAALDVEINFGRRTNIAASFIASASIAAAIVALVAFGSNDNDNNSVFNSEAIKDNPANTITFDPNTGEYSVINCTGAKCLVIDPRSLTLFENRNVKFTLDLTIADFLNEFKTLELSINGIGKGEISTLDEVIQILEQSNYQDVSNLKLKFESDYRSINGVLKKIEIIIDFKGDNATGMPIFQFNEELLYPLEEDISIRLPSGVPFPVTFSGYNSVTAITQIIPAGSVERICTSNLVLVARDEHKKVALRKLSTFLGSDAKYLNIARGNTYSELEVYLKLPDIAEIIKVDRTLAVLLGIEKQKYGPMPEICEG